MEICFEDYDGYTPQDKLRDIRGETNRIWSYLFEAINFIENKYYLSNYFDINELLAYCKSCEESNNVVEYLTYDLEDELFKLEKTVQN